MKSSPLADMAAMYPTKNDISRSQRTELNVPMNQLLASAMHLQLQMKQAHWNLKRPNFIGMHELFDEIDDAVEAYVDLIAERIAQLGGVAEDTIRVSVLRSRLPEYPLLMAVGSSHVSAVSSALATLGNQARAMIGEADELNDIDTADLFTELSRGIDKWLWVMGTHA